ncbi:response regulator [Aquibacillus koreensis]|uniref:Response regulator n=1 Tax=Aquibacillus koreensis TaxID=279446 RepID=A0A9X3WP49_9BACI|nr:response regulator [Aquibacillus koreensis]MCT2537038.1 response regulator [Aquibacillus koreensis]MDC3422308.1 response regulator [Aquibacillus koreensis]
MHSKTILIVDDEPRTRQGLKRTIDNWANGKYHIISAGGADEAIEVIKQHKINLLITDIRMPETTGLKLLEILKEEEINPVVIVVSAYSQFDYAQQALRLGVVNYLLKPVSKQKLIEAVEQALLEEQKRERSDIIEKVVDDKFLDINVEDRYTASIRDALAYIDEHYYKDLTLKEVADHVHLNASYLSALFKEQIQVTFSEYLTRSRLLHAKNLLMTTDLPITDIAEKVGYKTSKYFIKIFKQNEDITPNSYRKNNVSDS